MIAAIAKVAIAKALIGEALIGKSERQISRGENGMATYPRYRPNADKLDPSRAALQERRFKAGRPEHRPFAKAAWDDTAVVFLCGNPN